LPLWLAAVCLCAGLLVGDGSRIAHRVRNTQDSASQEEYSDDSQGISAFKDLLKPDNEYCFEYNAQISSGYAPRISPQQAMSRLRSKVCLGINQQNVGTFRMQNIWAGQSNDAYGSSYDAEYARYSVMQPLKSFKKAEDEEALKQKLQLPVEFSYNDGLVTNIQFHQDDEPWSKNIKKAVLNLIQLNASPSDTNLRNPAQPDEAEPQQDEEDRQSQQGQATQPKQNRAFTTMEANVEGICQTSYTVTPVESKRDSSRNTINITKSIDFERCEALADVAYGFQAEPRSAKINQDQSSGPSQDQSQTSRTGAAIPKEKLDRSTIIRYVLSKNAQKMRQQTGNTYGIKRVELASKYVVKSSQAESSQAMQTVAIAELNFLQCRDASQESANIDASQSRAESLLYNSDVESGEKEFFMKGDQTEVDVFRFSKKDGQSEIQKATRHLQNLVKIFVEENKKHGGIDSEQSAGSLEGLVKAMRRCSVDELRQVESKVQEKLQNQANTNEEVTNKQKQQIATDLFADALTIAATRNTIALMAEKIENSDTGDQQNGKAISEVKAVQLLTVLGRGAGLPAPSDAQVDSILSLCKSGKIQKSESGLKQACWLTFGTMVGELTLQSHKAKSQGITKTPMKETEICPETKIDQYKNELIEQLEAAETMYDKILALKCLGNAGLISAIPALRKVFTDKSEAPVVRINAIDALRRLKFRLPAEAIQSQILHLYANTEEDSEVRMKALGMIMRSRPTKAIIDQIAMVMANEKSMEVQSMAYSHIKAISESPLPEDKKCVDHLKNALKLAQVDQDQMDHKHALGSSQRRRYAAYNHQQQEGVFVDWTQVFSESDASELPSHINFGLDTFFNGQFNPNSAKLSICQKDIEKIAKQMSGKSQYDVEDSVEDNAEQDKDDEPGFFSKALESLKGLFGKANIKGRQKNQKSKKTGPYVIATFRLNNVDLAMAPLIGKDKAGTASQIARKAKQALASLVQRFSAGSEKVHMHLNAAVVVNSRMSSVPTSVGVGLRWEQSMYVLGQIKASGKVQSEGKMDIKLHPNFNWVQTQQMEIKTWNCRSGVQSTRSIEVNLPLEATTQQTKNRQSSNQEYRLSFKVPEKKATLFGAHSHATTFTKPANDSVEYSKNDWREAGDRKTVYNRLLSSQEREVNYMAGREGFLNIPLRVSGHYQQPRPLDSVQGVMNVIMSGDNSLHVEFHPGDTNRREVELTVGWHMFQSTSVVPTTSIRPRIQDFYKNLAQNGLNPGKGQQGRQPDYSDDDSDEDDWTANEQERVRIGAPNNEKQLNQDLEKQPKRGNKKHTVTVKVETIGSGRQNRASADLTVICDNKLRACDTTLNAERSPIAHERSDWTLKAQCQTLYPEHVSDLDELLEATEGEKKRQQKFFTHIEAEWGSSKNQQQSIKLNAEGEASKEVMKQIVERAKQNTHDDSSDEQHTQPKRSRCGRRCWNRKPVQFESLPRNSPFINMYTVVADYSLTPATEFLFQRQLEMLKSYYFWNTESRVWNNRRQLAQSATRSGSQRSEQINQGQLSALVSIDSITQQYANVTILTPSQKVKIRNMELPVKVSPMKLVRPSIQSISSRNAIRAVVGAVSRSKRSQCKVSSKTVDTFDKVALKAPSSTCYTLLAKDCSDPEKPQFAVLMKSVEKGSEEQKLKIITRKMLAVIESKGENEMRITVNDKAFRVENGQVSQQDGEEALRSYGIEVEIDKHDRQAVIVDLDQVSVKFNGRQATIQLSDDYKNVQCGLCGNFNGDAEDELRKGDNELADDVQSFHKSYTIQDEECAQQEHQQFYESANSHKFSDYSDKQQNEAEPTSQTMVKEFSHKVCFSLTPVKQCPQGWYPADEDEPDTQLLKRKNVNFSCFDRHSLEAKRLKHEARLGGTANIGDYSPSFTEEVVIPARCVVY